MDEFYRRLGNICQNNLTTEKLLLMPSHVAGRQVRLTLAHQGIPVLNFRPETIDGLLEQKSAPLLYEQGLELVQKNRCGLLILQILEELKAEGKLDYFGNLELTNGVWNLLQNTVREIRKAGYFSLPKEKDSFVQSEKAADLNLILDRFANKLEAKNWVDLALAVNMLKKEAGQKSIFSENTVQILLLPDSLQVSSCEKWFLARLKEKANRVFVLPTPPIYGLEKPGYYRTKEIKESAGNIFSYLYEIEKTGDLFTSTKKKDQIPAIELYSAYGESCEVRGVFRRLRGNNISFGRTLICYTEREPYSQLFYDLAELYDLPVTFGGGIGIENTSPGRLLSDLLFWYREDYAPKYLHRLLCRQDLEPADISLSALEIADHFRKLEVAGNRESYLKQAEKAKKEELKNFFKTIFEKLPKKGEQGNIRLDKLASGLCTLVEKFAVTEDKYAEEALSLITDKLNLLVENYQIKGEISRVISRFKEIVLKQRVGVSSPEPGKIHITSYRRGLWIDREQTFILGLDGDRFPGFQIEDPVLLNSERSELEGVKKAGASQSEEIYRLAQLLANRQGNVYLSYPCFDPAENREKSPASLLLQVYRLQERDPELDYSDLQQALTPVEEYIPRQEEKLLEESRFWLFHQREKSADDILSTVREVYPDIWQGREALQKRDNAEFNQFCGLIKAETEQLDPRENKRTISVSELEQMAKCPYAYFLNRVLGIEVLDDLEQTPFSWLDGGQRGSLLHRIYEKFYRQLKEKSELPSQQKHGQLLRDLAREETESLKEEFPPPAEIVFEREWQWIEESCHLFLAGEEEYVTEGISPSYFELYFGKGRKKDKAKIKSGPAILELPSGNKVRLSGKIDRIDQVGSATYDIIDYKTGSTYGFSNREYFRQGRQLQHALYALALEEIFKEEITVERSGYVFASLKGQGEKYWRERSGREKGLEIVELLLDTIRAGAFPPARFNRSDYTYCNVCDFNGLVCEREKYDNLNSIWAESEHRLLAKLGELEKYE